MGRRLKEERRKKVARARKGARAGRGGEQGAPWHAMQWKSSAPLDAFLLPLCSCLLVAKRKERKKRDLAWHIVRQVVGTVPLRARWRINACFCFSTLLPGELPAAYCPVCVFSKQVQGEGREEEKSMCWGLRVGYCTSPNPCGRTKKQMPKQMP